MKVLVATDHLTENQRLVLQFLRDIYAVSSELGTRTTIWGGLVPDILHGSFLRDHHDVDGFVLNLLDVKDQMAARFSERGYVVSYQHAYDLLRVDRGGLHAAFNRLETEGDQAMWRHVGDQGTIGFPVDWLALSPRSFYDVQTYVSGARFEYAIKSNVRLLSPEWQPRDKDLLALRVLETELDRFGLRPAQFLAEIWSETPYWVERGYPEYAKRIQASPPAKVEREKQR
jgi:hypothetical protein